MPEKKEKGTKKLRLPHMEEQVLWQEVTKDVKPLKKPRKKPDAPDVLDTRVDTERTLPVAKRPSHISVRGISPDLPLKPVPSVKEQKSGQQMSAAQRRKLEQGKLDIDARIDLHGLTLAVAHDKLMRFVLAQYRKKARCLLVITGKGARDETGKGQGVIRKNLPHWLETPDMAPLVLSLTEAHAQHGGSGAFYLYLRRQQLRD